MRLSIPISSSSNAIFREHAAEMKPVLGSIANSAGADAAAKTLNELSWLKIDGGQILCLLRQVEIIAAASRSEDVTVSAARALNLVARRSEGYEHGSVHSDSMKHAEYMLDLVKSGRADQVSRYSEALRQINADPNLLLGHARRSGMDSFSLVFRMAADNRFNGLINQCVNSDKKMVMRNIIDLAVFTGSFKAAARVLEVLSNPKLDAAIRGNGSTKLEKASDMFRSIAAYIHSESVIIATANLLDSARAQDPIPILSLMEAVASKYLNEDIINYSMMLIVKDGKVTGKTELFRMINQKIDADKKTAAESVRDTMRD